MASELESVEEVLVIGAGPSGLFTAAELARHGVRARVIEKDSEPHRQTRATGVQSASLEVLQRAGVLDRFLEAAQRIRRSAICDRSLQPVLSTSFDGMDTPYPFVASLPQSRTEALLAAHLRSCGGTVERGVCAETIDIDGGGSRVAVRHADGTRETIWARYLVGAGGAHGPVRGAMHEHLDGTTYPFTYLVADVSGELALDPQRLTVAITGLGMVMLIPLPEARWLALVDLPDDDRPAAPGLDDVCAALELHLGRAPVLRDLRWCSLFHTHRRIAPRFGDGHRFLVGDAAHICSPFGGEGMNAGLQDGADLAWKLALVTKGLGRPALLEAYDTERRCAAAQVLASADAMRNAYYAMIEMAAANRPIAMPAPDPNHAVTAPSMLDLSWCDSPIIGAFAAGMTPGRPCPGQRFRDRTALSGIMHHLIVFPGPRRRGDGGPVVRRWHRQVELLDARALPDGAAGRAGLEHGGALLVRPDGYIGFRAEVWNAEAAAALDVHLAAQLVPA